MKIKDCYSPSDIEIFRFALRLKRINLPAADLIEEISQFNYEQSKAFKGRGSGRRKPNASLDDLIISLL